MLNSGRALSILDQYVFPMAGKSSGFTSSFINSLYQSDMGNVLPTSDADVQRYVQTIIRQVQNDQIRAAVGQAKKIKSLIDAGEHTASEDDYELIQKVALRGQ